MHPRITTVLCFMLGTASLASQEQGPADRLPPSIRRLTQFGERADWSHDGKRILFVEKSYGDVFEADAATGEIRPVTHHFYHGGFTRALYLANGDVLLSGCLDFDAKNPHQNRTEKAELWVLDKSFKKPPVPLGTKCHEGPAVSRKTMRIAWTVVDSQYPDSLKKGQVLMAVADIVVSSGVPRLANQRVVLDNARLPFRCTPETQNFRPPDEKEIIFSAYGYQTTEVMGVDLSTGAVTNYSKADKQYDEPEGIFPDGQYTLVECDRHNLQGPGHVDIWKLKLDGSGETERLTFFSDMPGYKASNPVVSDDGRFMAFQMAKSNEPAGVGHGIFICDFQKLEKASLANAFGSSQIVQIGLVVKDIEASAKQYARILGMDVPAVRMTDPAAEAHTLYRGKPSGARARLAFFRMQNTTLELIEPVGGPSVWKDVLDARGEGVHHVAFEIKGMEEKLAALEALGIPLLQRGDYKGGRYAYVDARSQMGVIVELLEND